MAGGLSLSTRSPSPVSVSEMHVYRVEVSLKKGVADPEGANTRKTLDLLGFPGVKDVRYSKCYTITLDVDDPEKARDMVEEMCRRLLANPVIQTYRITPLEATGRTE